MTKILLIADNPERLYEIKRPYMFVPAKIEVAGNYEVCIQKIEMFKPDTVHGCKSSS